MAYAPAVPGDGERRKNSLSEARRSVMLPPLGRRVLVELELVVVLRRQLRLVGNELERFRRPACPALALPVAGQALLHGISTRKVPTKGFKVVIYNILCLVFYHICHLLNVFLF